MGRELKSQEVWHDAGKHVRDKRRYNKVGKHVGNETGGNYLSDKEMESSLHWDFSLIYGRDGNKRGYLL